MSTKLEESLPFLLERYHEIDDVFVDIQKMVTEIREEGRKFL